MPPPLPLATALRYSSAALLRCVCFAACNFSAPRKRLAHVVQNGTVLDVGAEPVGAFPRPGLCCKACGLEGGPGRVRSADLQPALTGKSTNKPPSRCSRLSLPPPPSPQDPITATTPPTTTTAPLLPPPSPAEVQISLRLVVPAAVDAAALEQRRRAALGRAQQGDGHAGDAAGEDRRRERLELFVFWWCLLLRCFVLLCCCVVCLLCGVWGACRLS